MSPRRPLPARSHMLLLPMLCLLLASRAPASPPDILLTDVTALAGLDFVETIGDDEMSNIVEATGVGCGFLDCDDDGLLDIYLVNGCWKQGISDPNLDPAKRAKLSAATDRLYRNRGNGMFEDVTVRAGVAKVGYGMGVTVADYDADGDPDLYVTNHGPNFLYRNNGDGTFTDVAVQAGVADPNFSVGAVFLDYDGDGRLDLYVGNYLTYVPAAVKPHDANAVRSPLAYEGQQDRLYRGNGDGTFTDVTRQAGLEIKPVGRAMGIGSLDCDADGLTDVFVSNDAMENFLWRNRGDGTFENAALLAGTAFGQSGAATAAMAVEVGDYDGDGRFDILVPDMNGGSLYRNLGGGMFEDLATRAGISPALMRYHSWGGVFADLDLDGDLDVYITNGSACRLEPQPDALFTNDGRGRFTLVPPAAPTTQPATQSAAASSEPPTQVGCRARTTSHATKKIGAETSPTRQRGSAILSLFHFHPSWRVPHSWATGARILSRTDTPAHTGARIPSRTDTYGNPFPSESATPVVPVPPPATPTSNPAPAPFCFVGRGVARGDFDNDGDLDLLVINLNARPVLLRNDTPRGGRHWLEVSLTGRGGNRDALGAIVSVKIGDRSILRHRASGGSYLSQHDPRLHFGLGHRDRIDLLEITWPDGTRQQMRNVPADRLLTITQPASTSKPAS